MDRTNPAPVPDKSRVWFSLAGQIRYFGRINPAKPDKSGSRPDMSVGHFQQQYLMTDLSVIC
jgi:hypothetical protein